jgi:hypothetical protein
MAAMRPAVVPKDSPKVNDWQSQASEPILAVCASCDETDYASPDVLAAAGWYIDANIALCPLDYLG